ncbi:unnamed protein product [Microthlaspi erraticum]|uniref:CCHC-type domain-containing protein n=1 Tax=Microthlaspi erraticum TaxID=1685480 RepID=A0A6D2KQX1_9BRAS|nr:unnamed protein product [Microthlaspi erraticum]
MGEAKILVEVELSKAFPPKIAASDKTGFISMVDVDYAWLPSKCGRCGQLGHKVKRCLQSEPLIVSEEENVLKSNATSPVPVNEPQSSTVSNLSLPLKDSVPIAAASATLPTENVSLVHPEKIVDPIECLSPKTATLLPASTPSTRATVQESKQAELSLGSNQFASLISFEEEDVTLVSPEEEEVSLDLDKESDLTDFMTPLGKRILRERPVKPSTKAKEMIWQVAGGGRGNRGRGKRGGRG